MVELVNNLNIIGFVIAVLSFVLAVVGAWDKISSIYFNWSLKANDKKIKNKEKQLAEVRKLNCLPNYFLAYALQKIFIMITIFFLTYVFGLSIAHINDVTNYNIILGGFASFFIGNISGNGYRVCRNIIHSEDVMSKLEKQIDALKKKP